jgi:hypothetical protein
MRTTGHRVSLLNLDSLRPLRLFGAVGHRTVPGILGLASIVFLTACGSASGPLFGNPNITISVAPQIASVRVNGAVTFTNTVTNTSSTPAWTLMDPYVGSTSNPGSLSTNSGPTTVYTAPATPPIYSPNAYYANGTVTLQASVISSFTSAAIATQTFVITAPSVTTGITPLTATVPLKGSADFTAYAVGNINNAITVQVNGVTGGSTSTGTIVLTAAPGLYLYTAPATMPMSGSTVTLTVISQADPTKTASSVITLQ